MKHSDTVVTAAERLHAALTYSPGDGESVVANLDAVKDKFVRVFDDTNPAHKYLLQLGSINSQVTMGHVLDRVAKVLMHDPAGRLEMVEWGRIKDVHLIALVRYFTNEVKLSPHTTRLYISAVKSVMVEAYFLDIIAEKQLKLLQRVKAPQGTRIRKHIALSFNEIQIFFAACDDGTALGARDAAAFAVLVGCGLRREEAATLAIDDISFDKSELKVIGKGNKQRLVPLQSTIQDRLLNWIDNWRGKFAGALFTGLRKNGCIIRKQLSVSGLYTAIKKRGMLLPIQPFMIHDLRRTFGTLLLDNDEDIFTVQDLLGHASVETTKRYDLRGNARKRRAVDKLKF